MSIKGAILILCWCCLLLASMFNINILASKSLMLIRMIIIHTATTLPLYLVSRYQVLSTKMQNWWWRILVTGCIVLLLIIIVIYFYGIFVADELTAVVYTTTGPVQGQILTTVNSVKYAAFSGIPYAKAPLGYLRFKPPVAVNPWTEILNATVERGFCIQYNSTSHRIEGTEDCLYINVETPVVDLTETATNLKSVIFWIYGGAFLTGKSFSETERRDYFLEKDIVFVSLNYRAGLFGYLALDHANATGNAALKDLVLGLKWVQGNIKKFGGNPNNVTIMGSSTGGALVSYLVISDAAKGLFHGAITMSGTLLCPWAFQTPAKALSQAEKLADLMGITWTDKETLLQAFYDASAEKIVDATSQIAKTFGPFRPTIEDASIATDVFLANCSMDKYISGNFSKVPHILGYADQETLVFFNQIRRVQDTIDAAFDAAEKSHLTLPQSIISAKDRMESYTNFYENLAYKHIEQFINDTSDLLYIAQIDETQDILAAANDNHPVYYYHLSSFIAGQHYIAPDNALPGGGHGDELPLIFYTPHRNYTDDATARHIISGMTTMWSNFAKYGNPTPHWIDDDLLNFTWPNSGSLKLSMRIGSEFSVDRNPVSENAKNLQKHTRQFLHEANGCL